MKKVEELTPEECRALLTEIQYDIRFGAVFGDDACIVEDIETRFIRAGLDTSSLVNCADCGEEVSSDDPMALCAECAAKDESDEDPES